MIPLSRGKYAPIIFTGYTALGLPPNGKAQAQRRGKQDFFTHNLLGLPAARTLSSVAAIACSQC